MIVDRLLHRPALTVFGLALTVRVFAAVVIWVVWDGTIFGDEATYSEMATAVVEGRAGGWDEYTRWLYWDTAAWTLPLTGLYALVSPTILAGQLLAAVMGAAAAAFTTVIAGHRLSPPWAVAAGLTVALFPSQILWSSLTLKDAPVWAAAALAGVAVTSALGATGRRRVGWAALLVLALVLMAYLRTHTFVVVTWAAAIAVALAGGIPPVRRLLAAGALLVSLPWVLGLGPAALGFLVDEIGTVDERRVANAAGAATAIEGAADGQLPAPPGGSPGDALAEPGASQPQPEGLGGADLGYLPRGISVMLFEPLPRTISGNQRVRLTALEHLVWYPLLVLAAMGLACTWNARRVLAYPLLAAAATTVVYGLAEGNFGTAYRHRGEIVWVVALLAAFGAERSWRQLRRRQGEPS